MGRVSWGQPFPYPKGAASQRSPIFWVPLYLCPHPLTHNKLRAVTHMGRWRILGVIHAVAYLQKCVARFFSWVLVKFQPEAALIGLYCWTQHIMVLALEPWRSALLKPYKLKRSFLKKGEFVSEHYFRISTAASFNCDPVMLVLIWPSWRSQSQCAWRCSVWHWDWSIIRRCWPVRVVYTRYVSMQTTAAVDSQKSPVCSVKDILDSSISLILYCTRVCLCVC